MRGPLSPRAASSEEPKPPACDVQRMNDEHLEDVLATLREVLDDEQRPVGAAVEVEADEFGLAPRTIASA